MNDFILLNVVLCYLRNCKKINSSLWNDIFSGFLFLVKMKEKNEKEKNFCFKFELVILGRLINMVFMYDMKI